MIIACLCILVSKLSAQTEELTASDRYSLEDCIGIALSNQPAIQVAQASHDAAWESMHVAHASFLPQIGLHVRYSHIDEPRSVSLDDAFAGPVTDIFSDAAAFFQVARLTNSSTALGALNNPDSPPFSVAKQQAVSALEGIESQLLGENFISSQLLLVQPLWTGGKISTRYQQAQLGANAACLEVAKVRQQTAFNVSRAYLAVLLARELAYVAEDAMGHARAIERLAQSLVDEGDEAVTAADGSRARTFRFFFQEQYVGLQRSVDRANTKLKLAMGFAQNDAVALADDGLPLIRHNLSWENISNLAMTQRPELSQTEFAIRIADLEVRAARAEYFPDIALFGGMTTIHDDQDFANPNDPEEWTVGVTAQVPVYTGGRRPAQIRRSQALAARARATQQQVVQLVMQEARDAFLQYLEMSERLHPAREAVDSATRTLQGFDDQFTSGLIAEDQLAKYLENSLSTRFLLAASQTKYYQALFGYNLALARLRLVTASDLLQEDVQDEAVPAPVVEPRPNARESVRARRSADQIPTLR